MIKVIGSIIGFLAYLIQVLVKKPAIAIKLYKLADKYDNRNGLSLAAYGMLLFTEEKYDAALEQFKKMKQIKKKSYLDRIIAMNIALCYWKLNSIDKAIEELEGLRSRYEYVNEDILTSLSYFYMLKGDYEEALNITNEALEDEPEHAPALDNMGQIYYRQGELEKAEEYFLKALEYKDMVDSKYYLGVIYEKQGNRDLAEKYFKKAYDTKVSRFSTVSKEDLQEKFREYSIIED